MADVVVMLSSLVFAALHSGEPEHPTAAHIAREVRAFDANVIYDTAFPDPDDPNLIYLTIVLDEGDGAERLAASLRDLPGVHASYVKPAADLP